MFKQYENLSYELAEHRRKALDEAAKQRFLTASGFYRQHLHQRLLAGMGAALVRVGTRLQQPPRRAQAVPFYRPEMGSMG